MQARREEQAERQSSLRAAETPEQSHQRQAFTRNTWAVFYKAAFEYHATLDYSSHRLIIKMERMSIECRFCRALKWKVETAGMCCSEGKVSIPLLKKPVEPLKQLFSYKTENPGSF
ncbi:hypothetical protein PR048_008393 [Dryococelus australis]|uniref:Uncharacterized protein n=1 Tax=Dryococelus australis TaxID=614101 RepID=A0ABQ9HX06_9NEOP|nr:hypothetical protein PR048_008393 [Dryococelus australis]